jgi:hypothetical protein
LHDFRHLPEEIILSCNEEFRETRLGVVSNLFIGIELRRVAPQMLDNDVAITLFNEPLQYFAAMVAGIVRDHDDRLAGIRSEIFKELHEPGTIHSSLEGANLISPRGLTALISLRPKRPPLSATTGVSPIFPQVVPRCASERTAGVSRVCRANRN